jgi:hypothetical protein
LPGGLSTYWRRSAAVSAAVRRASSPAAEGETPSGQPARLVLSEVEGYRRYDKVLESCRLVAQHGQGETIFIAGLRLADFRLGLLQLGLAEFHDRSQAELVAGL